jgi:hypothetical protein
MGCFGTYEVNTDSVKEIFVEGVFGVPEQQTRFTDA